MGQIDAVDAAQIREREKQKQVIRHPHGAEAGDPPP